MPTTTATTKRVPAHYGHYSQEYFIDPKCVSSEASAAASAVNAAIEHVHDWVNGTTEGDRTSVAMPSDGSYGIPEGIICSFPAVSRGGAWEIVQGLDIAADARAKIDASVAELVAERDAVRELGLI